MPTMKHFLNSNSTPKFADTNWVGIFFFSASYFTELPLISILVEENKSVCLLIKYYYLLQFSVFELGGVMC